MPTFLVSELAVLPRRGNGQGDDWVEVGGGTISGASYAAVTDETQRVRACINDSRRQFLVEADSGTEAVGIIARFVNQPGEWIAREVEAVKVGLAVESG